MRKAWVVLALLSAWTCAPLSRAQNPPRLYRQHPQAKELLRVAQGLRENIAVSARQIEEALLREPDGADATWRDVEAMHRVAVDMLLHADPSHGPRLRAIRAEIERRLKALLADAPARDATIQQYTAARDALDVAIDDATDDAHVRALLARRDATSGALRELLRADVMVEHYAERWSALTRAVDSPDHAIEFWDQCRTDGVQIERIYGSVWGLLFEGFVARGDWAAAGSIPPEPVRLAAYLADSLDVGAPSDRRGGTGEAWADGQQATIIEQGAMIYGALLAAGRESEARAVAGVFLERFGKGGVCCRCALVDVALEVGEARGEQLLWLAQCGCAESGAARELQKRLVAALAGAS